MILMIGLAVAGWLGAGLFFGLWIWSRRTARESVRVVGGINHESRELLVREVDELARALKVEQRRAEEFFTKINDAVLERNTWQASYYRESIQHGNAQNLMLAGIEKLHFQLYKATGGKVPKIDPIFAEVRDEHKTEHVLPSIAGIAAIKQQLALETEGPNAVPPKTEVSE
jgi:hypothetical protein